MRGYNLRQVYDRLLDLGAVKSQRDFSRSYLRRNHFYFRDYVLRDRDDVRVSDKTVHALRNRLQTVARYCSPLIQAEINDVVREIDYHSQVADMLGFESRGARRPRPRPKPAF